MSKIYYICASFNFLRELLFWLPCPIFEESGSRHYESGLRQLTKDPKTDLKSERSKLSKTVSTNAVTTNLKKNAFLKNLFQIEEKIKPKMLKLC